MITHQPIPPPASTQICVPHQTHSHNKHTQQTHATNSHNLWFCFTTPIPTQQYPEGGSVVDCLELWIHVPSVMTAMAHAVLVMWLMLQSTIDHATERIIAHGPARRTYAYQSPQTRINDYTPTHLTARVHPNLCSPPNPFPQQTRSTNTHNKLTQPVVLFYPTNTTTPISAGSFVVPHPPQPYPEGGSFMTCISS